MAAKLLVCFFMGADLEREYCEVAADLERAVGVCR